MNYEEPKMEFFLIMQEDIICQSPDDGMSGWDGVPEFDEGVYN